MGQTGFCKNLRFSAKICGFLRFSAKICASNAPKERRRKLETNIHANLVFQACISLFRRFSGVDKRVASKRVVLADVPRHQKLERGYIRMFPRNEYRNLRSHVPPERKPGRGHVRQNHPFTKPPFYLPVSFRTPGTPTRKILECCPALSRSGADHSLDF